MPINAGPNRSMFGKTDSYPQRGLPTTSRPQAPRPMPGPGINAGPSPNIAGPMNPSRGIPPEQGGFISPQWSPLPIPPMTPMTPKPLVPQGNMMPPPMMPPQMGGMGQMPIDTAPLNIPNMGPAGMGQIPLMGGNPTGRGLRNAYSGGGPALANRPTGLR